MSYLSLTLLERLFFSYEALTIIQEDPVVAATLLEYGYTPERIAIGLGLYTEAYNLTKLREDQFGEQLLATEARNALYKRIRSQFAADRRILREVLRGRRSDYESFGLNNRIYQRREQAITQAQFFYQEILAEAEVLANLQERFNITSELIQSRLEELDTLVEAMKDQQVQLSEARRTTRRRREAMGRLDRWMSTLMAVARRAFRDDPEQLAKLGL